MKPAAWTMRLALALNRLPGLGLELRFLDARGGASCLAALLAVQCTIDSYRSSYADQPDSFTIQVDLDATTISTFYGTMPLTLTRKSIRGVGKVDGGWQSSVIIDRRSGHFEAGTDRVEGRKYSYVEVKGTCILPPELQGPGYRSPTG